MGSVNRLVGDRVGIVNRLVRNTLAISDKTSVSWPITVITGSAGSGKTRIVQEVYVTLRDRLEGVSVDGNEVTQRFWPAIDSGDVTLRKCPGPTPAGFVWPERTMPGFAWWTIGAHSGPSSSAMVLTDLQDQLIRYRKPLQLAFLHGNPSGFAVAQRNALFELVRTSATEEVGDALVKLLESTLGQLPLLKTWISWALLAARWGGQLVKDREAYMSRVETNPAVTARLVDEAVDVAKLMASVAGPRLPAVVAVEDAHLMTAESIGLLARLAAASDPTRPIHIVCTALPEKQAPSDCHLYRWLHQQTAAGRVRSIAVPPFDLDNITAVLLDHAPRTTEAARLIASLPEDCTPLFLQKWLATPRARAAASGTLPADPETLATIGATLADLFDQQWQDLPSTGTLLLRVLHSLGNSTDPPPSFVTHVALRAAASVRDTTPEQAKQALELVVEGGWVKSSGQHITVADPTVWASIAHHAPRGANALTTEETAHVHATAMRELHGWIKAAIAEFRWMPSDPAVRAAATMRIRLSDQQQPLSFQTLAERAVWLLHSELPGRDPLEQQSVATLATLASAQLPNQPESIELRKRVVYQLAKKRALREAIQSARLLLGEQHEYVGIDHPDTLATRSNIALWTGEAGDAARALRLFTELLPDQARVLGADHPGTLATRNYIATWAGQAGDSARALQLSTELLPDLTRVLGVDHPDTLITRGNIAAWAGRAGDSARALRLSTELLPDLTRVLGVDHPGTLATRGNVAAWAGRAGDSARALRLLTELLPDQARVLGADHPDTLTTRNYIAAWAGRAGDSARALQLLTELLPDQARVLGTDHPDTLATRNNVAAWAGRAGDSARALQLFTELLPDLTRLLGTDHPGTLATRGSIALWTGRAGDAARALRLFTELLPDQARVLGADHPDTLATRGNIALWTGRAGDAARALRLFTELLPDLTRVLGADHPDTLATRNNAAAWRLETGDSARALRLLTELLPDLARVLGADHPDTLATRNNVAASTGGAGDAARALQLFTELLPDQARVLGADHPDTLTTRNNVAAWAGRAGDSARALQLFTELLPDQARVLGTDHPDTLTTRESIDYWAGKANK